MHALNASERRFRTIFDDANLGILDHEKTAPQPQQTALLTCTGLGWPA